MGGLQSKGVKVYSIQYTVVKGLPYTVDCRHWQKNTRAPGHVHVYMHVCVGVLLCGVTTEEFYERYHETESGRTGHLIKIGEEVEVQ